MKKKYYTLTELCQILSISMPTLKRYKKNYQDRIPSIEQGRKQRYPSEAIMVFKQIRKENQSRLGRPRHTLSCCPRCMGTSGFEFTIKILMVGFWGEQAESSDTLGSKCNKVKCLDCGSLISRQLAERSN